MYTCRTLQVQLNLVPTSTKNSQTKAEKKIIKRDLEHLDNHLKLHSQKIQSIEILNFIMILIWSRNHFIIKLKNPEMF